MEWALAPSMSLAWQFPSPGLCAVCLLVLQGWVRALSQTRHLLRSCSLGALLRLQLQRGAEVRCDEVRRQCALECALAVPQGPPRGSLALSIPDAARVSGKLGGIK